MLTRRQFLTGMGVLTASALLGLGCGCSRSAKGVNRQPIACDWVVDNVKIIDGSGNLPFIGKVAVKGDTIVAVGDFETEESISAIDGKGFVLTPGFIDIHTHTEEYVFRGESMAPFLSQGVTMQIGGNCGRSFASIADFFNDVPDLEINYGKLMGYKTLRRSALNGDIGRKVTPSELTRMQEQLYKAMQEGALGMSVGLEYWPQNYATTEELISLCEVVKDGGGFYATHIRSEYDNVLTALEEAIEISIKTGVPVQYSHTKAGFPHNWPKYEKILDMLEEAVESGVDISADVYAYTFSSTDLGKKPLKHSISEENLEAALAHPVIFFGSDSGIYNQGRATHPRTYGNFTRTLRLVGQEKKLLPLEKVVHKLTALPARRLKQKNRGLIGPGYKADLVLFKPEEVTERSTLTNPCIFSEGIRQVWVNGELAWKDGKTGQNRAGQKIAYV